MGRLYPCFHPFWSIKSSSPSQSGDSTDSIPSGTMASMTLPKQAALAALAVLLAVLLAALLLLLMVHGRVSV